MDHTSVVVDDLDAAVAFFVELGLELEGRMELSGPTVDRLLGIDGVHTEIAMVRPPDGHGGLELTRYLRPEGLVPDPDPSVPNGLGPRQVMFEVDDLPGTVDRLRAHAGELLGEVVEYEDTYRLAYVRGPAGLIVALAEPLG